VGNSIIGWDAQATFEEEKAIFELIQGVSFWVLDNHAEELVVGV